MSLSDGRKSEAAGGRLKQHTDTVDGVTGRDSGTIRRAALVAAVGLLLVGLLAVGIHTALNDNTLGGDFYIFWQAGRAFFFERVDPYSWEVTRRVQLGYYHGRLAGPGEDPMKFAYPAYVLLPIYPLLWLSFDWAQAVWMALNILLVAGVLLGVLRAGPKWVAVLVLFLYQMTFGLILGNFVVAFFAILVWVLDRLLTGRMDSVSTQILAGLALAWTTAKPQFVWLYLVFILVYSLRQKRAALIGGFALGLAGLVGISLGVRPDWPFSWLGRVTEYSGYLPMEPALETILRFLIGARFLPAALAVVKMLVVALSVYFFWKWYSGKVAPLLFVGWCGFAVYLLHPTGISYDQLSFVIPLVLWTACCRPRPVVTGLVWGSAVLLSYVFFTISVLEIAPHADYILPCVLYLTWLGWFALRSSVEGEKHAECI